MKNLRALSSALFPTLAILALVPSLVQGAETYQVDPIHSTLIFQAKHMGTSNFYGRFNDVSGSFRLDDANPANGAFQVQVKAESIDTGNAKRDQHLKSPDFFNSKQFPLITFKSTQVKKGGDGSYEATGDLTLHGVTRPVSVSVAKTGAGKDPRGRQIAGVEAKLTLKRSDFGMRFMLEGVSDEVQITVSLEGGH
jgi:polyisoprenoid-binding protein YceI